MDENEIMLETVARLCRTNATLGCIHCMNAGAVSPLLTAFLILTMAATGCGIFLLWQSIHRLDHLKNPVVVLGKRLDLLDPLGLDDFHFKIRCNYNNSNITVWCPVNSTDNEIKGKGWVTSCRQLFISVCSCQ